MPDKGADDEDDDAPLAELISRPRSAPAGAGGIAVHLRESHRSLRC